MKCWLVVCLSLQARKEEKKETEREKKENLVYIERFFFL